MKQQVSVFWFRRDLRLHDNVGLYAALSEQTNVMPIFIFDTSILDHLEDRDDARVNFIHQEITRLSAELKVWRSGIRVFLGKPLEVFKSILEQYELKSVYTNHDYEPYARSRDESIGKMLQEHGVLFKTFKDQVIFERSEVMKDDGTPYTVFTPYSKKWKARLEQHPISSHPVHEKASSLVKDFEFGELPSLQQIGFQPSKITFPKTSVSADLLARYKEQRDIPSIEGTSRLSVHLRFGTISVRDLVKQAIPLSETWLNELIWREFYHMILWHFPQVVDTAFKPIYDTVIWRNNESEFKAWCEGKTGYPIVDAGMRQLKATGFMHNRVRMITASFLTKHLLIDWRWGEAWFARHLLDFDLAANNGGWQWAASSGCDAAPYFRVFNPYLQTEKFDPLAIYIKRWVPEFSDPFAYPKPIVDHSLARERVLVAYKTALTTLG